MDSTLPGPAERRTANRRVGAAALAAFVALLVLAAAHGPAQASPPQSTPGNGTQPQPQDHDGMRGRRDGRGGPGFGGPPGMGGQTAPSDPDAGGFDGGGRQATPAPSDPSTSGGTTT